jgi:hypothetical protein
MNCTECREILVGYIEKLLKDSQKKAVESHLETCPPCRAELEALTGLRDRLTANGKALAQRNLENKVLDRILQEQSLTLKKAEKADRQVRVWRIIMKSQITKFAAVAVIIIVAGLLISFLGTSEPAYALAQTIEASHSVRYLHIVNYVTAQDEPIEVWVEFDLRGQLKNMRFHKPAWMDPDDGATIIVWKDNKMQLWSKKKNFLVTLKDEEMAAQALQQAEQLDPRFAVERLQREQELGNTEVDIEVPTDKGEPIVVTATSLKDDEAPFQRIILFVDQATKLVNSVELYKLKDGEYHKELTLEYYDYNQPIDAKMFSLDQELSPDATQIDQTAQGVGLVQGDLSDKQVAAELVRQFLQALIDKDYAKAGRLFSGVPAERIERTYGNTRFIRIISIGEPVPHSLTGGLYVPCTVEIEENGQIRQWHPEHSYVRRVHGQPERWEIIGGFRGV